MKNLKIGLPSQWIASYVARSGQDMLVITLIYLLPFDKKLQEPLRHPVLSSSAVDNLMILLIR